MEINEEKKFKIEITWLYDIDSIQSLNKYIDSIYDIQIYIHFIVFFLSFISNENAYTFFLE